MKITLYFLVTNIWSVVETNGRCPPARDGHSACIIGDSMIIFGGFEEELQRFSQETFAFNFKTLRWTDLRTNVCLLLSSHSSIRMVDFRDHHRRGVTFIRRLQSVNICTCSVVEVINSVSIIVRAMSISIDSNILISTTIVGTMQKRLVISPLVDDRIQHVSVYSFCIITKWCISTHFCLSSSSQNKISTINTMIGLCNNVLKILNWCVDDESICHDIQWCIDQTWNCLFFSQHLCVWKCANMSRFDRY
jgi:hypothetical protein